MFEALRAHVFVEVQGDFIALVRTEAVPLDLQRHPDLLALAKLGAGDDPTSSIFARDRLCAPHIVDESESRMPQADGSAARDPSLLIVRSTMAQRDRRPPQRLLGNGPPRGSDCYDATHETSPAKSNPTNSNPTTPARMRKPFTARTRKTSTDEASIGPSTRGFRRSR